MGRIKIMPNLLKAGRCLLCLVLLLKFAALNETEFPDRVQFLIGDFGGYTRQISFYLFKHKDSLDSRSPVVEINLNIKPGKNNGKLLGYMFQVKKHFSLHFIYIKEKESFRE